MARTSKLAITAWRSGSGRLLRHSIKIIRIDEFRCYDRLGAPARDRTSAGLLICPAGISAPTQWEVLTLTAAGYAGRPKVSGLGEASAERALTAYRCHVPPWRVHKGTTTTLVRDRPSPPGPSADRCCRWPSWRPPPQPADLRRSLHRNGVRRFSASLLTVMKNCESRWCPTGVGHREQIGLRSNCSSGWNSSANL